MLEFFEVNIANRIEKLPIIALGGGISIAFFNLHGNVDLVEHCAKELSKLVKNVDILITAESKGLQLTHSLARALGHKFYAVARKSKKLYMLDGLETTVNSITTKGEQKLYLSLHDCNLLKGKRVAIIDDVISTGASVKALERLVEKAGGEVILKAAVLLEGDWVDSVIHLGKIPIFKE